MSNMTDEMSGILDMSVGLLELMAECELGVRLTAAAAKMAAKYQTAFEATGL